jgi:hypothetical protein
MIHLGKWQCTSLKHYLFPIKCFQYSHTYFYDVDQCNFMTLIMCYYIHHLGRPRVTVARQSDWALFALGINLVNSAPLCMGKKVANHSPWTPWGKQTSSKDIWSGGFPFLSNTFTHISNRGHFRYACTWRFGLLPDSFKITCSRISLYKCRLVYGMCCRWSGCSFRWTHSIVWDSGLTSRVKGV